MHKQLTMKLKQIVPPKLEHRKSKTFLKSHDWLRSYSYATTLVFQAGTAENVSLS